MAICRACGAQDVRRNVLIEYQAADLIAAPFPVVLEGAVVEGRCGVCNEVVDITIPNPRSLVATVAVARACAPQKLNGREIRFLRKAAQWKGAELADKLGVDPATVSRWEHGTRPISEPFEKHLRLRVCAELGWFAPLVRFDPKVLASLKIVAARDVMSGFALRLWQEDAQNEIWASDGLPAAA